MLFSSRLPLAALVSLCQAFRVSLAAGLSLVDVFRQQTRKGPLAARPVVGRIADRLDRGESIEDVLKDEGKHFPPLFVGMISVGERSGALPEVFRELENYYREQLTLRRQFLSQIVWPVIQFLGAIAVICFMLLILGILAGDDPKNAFDPIGLGVGMPGVLKFLTIVGFLLGGLVMIYLFATKVLGKTAAIHRFMLNVPVIGPCLHALALSRFCLALKLTMDSQLSTHKAMRRSLLATGNGAYEECADKASSAIKKGDDISQALTRCGVFPEDFLQIVATGEVSGQLPEVMGQQAGYYQEQASMRMKILTMFASFAVWGMVAVFIIFLIFRIALKYLGMIDDAANFKLN
jgi:type II secretory pathway component PulF